MTCSQSGSFACSISRICRDVDARLFPRDLILPLVEMVVEHGHREEQPEQREELSHRAVSTPSFARGSFTSSRSARYFPIAAEELQRDRDQRVNRRAHDHRQHRQLGEAQAALRQRRGHHEIAERRGRQMLLIHIRVGAHERRRHRPQRVRFLPRLMPVDEAALVRIAEAEDENLLHRFRPRRDRHEVHANRHR